MAKATIHVADVGGYPGPARCFEVDPPYGGARYVTVWVQRSFGQHQLAEACVVPATETGACAEHSLKRRPGSYVLHEEPNTPQRIDGAYWLALLMLGGYQTEPVVDAP
ncbi:hypothetical protein ACFVMC_00255 [Nocardia sp. NPDC127579]|uniref:hypothetical protein n=1 Tax=Nocardia sp. NPDC127579 TaxID=3345402 RepID=UPI00364223FA